MIYLKSAVIGAAAVLVAAILGVIGIVVYLMLTTPEGEGSAIGWDPISAAKEPLVWVLALLVFLAGFLWRFRQLSGS